MKASACTLLVALMLAASPAIAADARVQATAAAGACAASPSIDRVELRRLYAGPITQWPRACVAPGVMWREFAALPMTPPSPATNPGTAEKIALGRRLFHDPRLSRSGQIACANCHEQDLGWADGRRVSFGHDRAPTLRHAPSVRYAAYADRLFWDGRAASLEAQAMAPILHANEMAFDEAGLEARLQTLDDYAEDARTVYGRERLQPGDVASALAAFQRSLAKPRGRYQAFLRGQRDALPDQALHGLHLFRTRAGCMNCHHGETLSDGGFHNLGISFYGSKRQDLGRYTVTGRSEDVGAFRTPSLLGVGETAPYMHAGHFRDLRTVLSMYRVGMPQPKPRGAQTDDPLYPRQSPLLAPIALDSADIEAIEAFLHTL